LSFNVTLTRTYGLFHTVIAKKLKKTWVDTKKIKSKWKAEKRKERLVGGSASTEQRRQPSDDTQGGPSRNSDDEADEDLSDERASTPSKRPSIRTHGHAGRTEQILEAQKEDSLRDMTREAYSRSSLHTYKSDPLRRSRGRGTRGTGEIGRGRGQPNMKLRMGAMLEKIKRDYS
jgi:hypothetical protein